MSRKNLTANEHAKVASAFANKHAAPLQMDGYQAESVTLIIDLAMGNEAEIFDILDTLALKGWVEGSIIMDKLDGYGLPINPGVDRYVSVLSNARNIRDADGVHGMLSAKVFSAFHWNDYPLWASIDGYPAHHYCGVPVAGTTIRPMRRRSKPIEVIIEPPDPPE